MLAMIVNGLISLRAYRKFDFFKQSFMQSIEVSANASFNYYAVHRWFAIRLDMVCVCFNIATAIFAVSFKNIISRNLLTMSLQLVVDMISTFSAGIRFMAELQNMMTSPQRIH